MAYPPEEREAALTLYVEEGPDIAAQRTGIGVRTIYRWAAAEGLATTAVSERTRAATTAAKERAGMVRAELQALLMEQAVKALHAMDEEVPKVVTVIEGRSRSESYEMVPADPRDKKDLALTAAVLIDKYRLEAGEATGRFESVNLTDDIPADTKRELRSRLARSVRGESELAGEASHPVGVGEPVDS